MQKGLIALLNSSILDMQMLVTEVYDPSWTPLEFMLELSSSVLWIGPTVTEFSYCAQKEVIPYVQKWELPWLLKIGMRGLLKKKKKKDIWHLQQYSSSSGSDSFL